MTLRESTTDSHPVSQSRFSGKISNNEPRNKHATVLELDRLYRESIKRPESRFARFLSLVFQQ